MGEGADGQDDPGGRTENAAHASAPGPAVHVPPYRSGPSILQLPELVDRVHPIRSGLTRRPLALLPCPSSRDLCVRRITAYPGRPLSRGEFPGCGGPDGVLGVVEELPPYGVGGGRGLVSLVRCDAATRHISGHCPLFSSTDGSHPVDGGNGWGAPAAGLLSWRRLAVSPVADRGDRRKGKCVRTLGEPSGRPAGGRCATQPVIRAGHSWAPGGTRPPARPPDSMFAQCKIGWPVLSGSFRPGRIAATPSTALGSYETLTCRADPAASTASCATLVQFGAGQGGRRRGIGKRLPWTAPRADPGALCRVLPSGGDRRVGHGSRGSVSAFRRMKGMFLPASRDPASLPSLGKPMNVQRRCAVRGCRWA